MNALRTILIVLLLATTANSSWAMGGYPNNLYVVRKVAKKQLSVLRMNKSVLLQEEVLNKSYDFSQKLLRYTVRVLSVIGKKNP